MELINDSSCRVGTDAAGNTWYEKIQEDGSQLWASTRGGVLQNAGKNVVPRDWDDATGFHRKPFRERRGD